MKDKRSLVGAVVTVIAVASSGLLHAGPVEAGVEVAAHDCAWTEFTRLPGFSTFPDTNTLVYQSVYSAGPAHHTVITGRVPAARFFSFAVLDQARREIANLSDDQIVVAADGTYEVAVRLACDGAPNCLSVSSGPAPVAPERIFYRLYVPDDDDFGGVALPKLSYRGAGPEAQADLAAFAGRCAEMLDESTHQLRPGSDVHEASAEPSGLEPAVAPGATGAKPDVVRYEGTGGRQLRQAQDAGVPAEVLDAAKSAAGGGGFGATKDNAYVTVSYNIRQGNLALRAKAPSYRMQHAVAANDLGVSSGEQVRYWSLCTTQESRPVDCLRDENVVLGQDGYFELTVAPSCPPGSVNCLRAGKLGAAGGAAVGILLYRNLLGADEFYNEPYECVSPESMFCGAYTLDATYVPRA